MGRGRARGNGKKNFFSSFSLFPLTFSPLQKPFSPVPLDAGANFIS
jgi:hypothetical protein